MISRPLAPPTLFPDGEDRTHLCGGRSAGRRTAAPASPPDRGSETSLPALLPGPGRPSRGHGTLLKEQRGVIALGTGRYAKHKGGQGAEISAKACRLATSTAFARAGNWKVPEYQITGTPFNHRTYLHSGIWYSHRTRVFEEQLMHKKH